MLAPSRRLLLYLRQACKAQSQASSALNGSQRATALFSTSACANSGHSKWATIKHDKARADAKKNKQRSMLAQQIELMSKLYGPDPDANPRLKTVVADAKRQGLPRDILESAVKRGQGLSTTGKPLEPLTVEALLPGNVAAIISCVTESKAKTLMEVRTILTKNGAQQGVVGFLFQRRGVIRVRLPDGEEGVGVDELLEKLLEVEGFEDFGDVGSEEGIVPIFSEPSAVKAVADAVESLKGVEVVQMQISWVPGDLVDASGEDVALVDDLVEKLEEVTEVQEVCLNMRRPEQEPDLRATL